MNAHEPEATHHLPDTLTSKLIEAKGWYDRCPASAPSDDEERARWGAEGTVLMMDVVEIVEKTWGYAVELGDGA
jgi:hypothetical protein